MGSNQIFLVLSLLSFAALSANGSIASPDSVIQMVSESRDGDSYLQRKITSGDREFCESWRFTVETNDAGPWSQVPSRCSSFVKHYVTGHRYISDSEAVADAALAFAKTVEIAGDGKDAWVFDIDETLLSNLAYYADHGFGQVKPFIPRMIYLPYKYKRKKIENVEGM